MEEGSTVFIKPNFTYPFYKEGITTSPPILKSLMGILKDRAGRVIVGESNGGNHSFTADQAFKGHNMHEICKGTGAELVNLSNIPSACVSDKIQGKKVKVQLPKLLLEEIDCFISVPVLKVHVMTGVTLGIKNLWGCYPDTMRCLHHKHLGHKLALITKMLNPRLVVIDGIYSLDGHGPMYGTPKRTDLLISADNPVVSDSLGSQVMGMASPMAEHILLAENVGLGSRDLNAAILNGDPKKFQMKFYANKSMIDNISTLLFNSEMLAKLAMDSPATPIIYQAAPFLRTADERAVSEELGKFQA